MSLEYKIHPLYEGCITYTRDGVYHLSHCTQSELKHLYATGHTDKIYKIEKQESENKSIGDSTEADNAGGKVQKKRRKY